MDLGLCLSLKSGFFSKEMSQPLPPLSPTMGSEVALHCDELLALRLITKVSSARCVMGRYDINIFRFLSLLRLKYKDRLARLNR